MLKGLGGWLTGILVRAGKPNWPVAVLTSSIILSPVIFIAAVSYTRTRQDLTDLALSRRQSLAFLAAATLKADLDRLRDIGISLATRVRFRDLVGQGRWIEAVGILQGIPKTFQFVDRVFLADREGTLMADTPELPNVRGKSFAFRDWYQGVSRAWEPYVSEVYRRAAGPRINVFAVAIPIQSESGEVAGILVLQVKLDVLLEWTKHIEIGPEAVLYVVDRKGHLASHPKVVPDADIIDYSAERPVREALRGKRGIEIAVHPGEAEESVCAYEPVAGYGWGILLQQPAAAAFSARGAVLRSVLYAYGLIVLFSACLTYVIFRTLIERKVAEERIARLNDDLNRRAAELDASNKELEAFSYSVSHDLRAPVRHISGFVGLLQEEAGSIVGAGGKRYLEKIAASARRMGELIDDLLVFSRMGRAEMRDATVDLARMVAEVRDELKEEAKGRRIEWKIGPMPLVRGDASLLKMALTNLISNALKYTRKRDEARVEIGSEAPNGEIVVFVRDNGVGFDPQYAHKLFGVFQRLHAAEEFEGTGVGLANVRRIVNRHGGRTWAQGEVDRGAAFFFSLPKLQEDGK